jgi:hypothetical protein
MSLTGFESYTVELTPRLQAKIPDLLWLLKSFATFDKPRHSAILEKELKLTGPEIRKMAAHCILKHIAPIGSDERGYWICQNSEQTGHASAHRIQRGTANLAVGYSLKNYFEPEEQGSLQL